MRLLAREVSRYFAWQNHVVGYSPLHLKPPDEELEARRQLTQSQAGID